MSEISSPLSVLMFADGDVAPWTTHGTPRSCPGQTRMRQFLHLTGQELFTWPAAPQLRQFWGAMPARAETALAEGMVEGV